MRNDEGRGQGDGECLLGSTMVEFNVPTNVKTVEVQENCFPAWKEFGGTVHEATGGLQTGGEKAREEYMLSILSREIQQVAGCRLTEFRGEIWIRALQIKSS